MRFSLSVSHTPWISERVESFKRLQKQLGGLAPAIGVMSDKAPNHVWSERMWRAAVGGPTNDADWCVFLQDDTLCTTVGPLFAIDAAIKGAELAGCDFVGLHVPHPAARPIYEEGCAGFTTRDMIIGVAYAARRETLRAFLGWRAALPALAVENITEDSLLALYAASHGGVYHPLPTAFDHDVSIPSTYANDQHKHRRGACTYPAPERDLESSRVPHLGCFYASTPALLESLGEHVQAAQAKADTGERERRRIRYAQLGRGHTPKARLWVGTPTRDTVGAAYAHSVWQLLRDENWDVSGDLEITNVQIWTADVVRVRNRMAWHFLNKTDATHLLFLDDDIEFTPATIRGMLAADKSFVAAPYPQRNGVRWKEVVEAGADPTIPPECAAYKYHVRTISDTISLVAGDVAEVEAIPLGCALIRREELAAMAGQYGHYYDRDIGAKVEDLFGLAIHDDPDGRRGLLSEDYSFCKRWRASGNGVYMYLGPGSPVTHHGHHRYQGHIEAFNLRRV